MTREEFIDRYRRQSGRGDQALQHLIALPCYCGDKSCDGWAMVSDDPAAIAMHRDLYGGEKPAPQQES